MGRRVGRRQDRRWPGPPARPKALSAKAVWFALALGADPKPDAVVAEGDEAPLEDGEERADRERVVVRVARDPAADLRQFGREHDGARDPGGRCPRPRAGDDAAKAVRDKGVRWLAETKTDDDPQSIAMRLVLWTRLGRPAEEWEPLVRRIKERQNADGGWSQAKDMASDAWATGQALYALAHAGIKPDEPVIARGTRLPDQDATRRRLLADDVAAGQARRRRVKEPDPDHRRRQRVGGPGAGAEPLSGW